MNFLIGYSGRHYMDSIGNDISAYTDAEQGDAGSFNLDTENNNYDLMIIVSDAQESFGATNWLITAAVTLLGGVLAYFVTGSALRPLRDFTSQIEKVQPNNLVEMKIAKDVLPEFEQFSASFNNMIARLDEGFAAQRQFTGNAAHELRTPLALMQAQMELYEVEHPDAAPEVTEFLKLLREQTGRMSQMTKALLEMSELRTIPCNDAIELAPLLEEVCTDLAPLAESKGISLVYDGDAAMVGSDTLVYRAVFNLTENAIRYSRPDTVVCLSAAEEGDRICLRVIDAGPGIPEQYRQSIFQPFFRVDMSRSREHGGVGLGLALVWEIAVLHGGTAQVEESSENRTTMLIALPKRGTNSGNGVTR